MSCGDLYSTSNSYSATCDTNHDQNPQGAADKTSISFGPFSLAQLTLEFSVNNFSLAFAFGLLCLVFIAFSAWDLFIHHRNLQSRSLSD
jgi:uncharacterized membrane protein